MQRACVFVLRWVVGELVGVRRGPWACVTKLPETALHSCVGKGCYVLHMIEKICSY